MKATFLWAASFLVIIIGLFLVYSVLFPDPFIMIALTVLTIALGSMAPMAVNEDQITKTHVLVTTGIAILLATTLVAVEGHERTWFINRTVTEVVVDTTVQRVVLEAAIKNNTWLAESSVRDVQLVNVNEKPVKVFNEKMSEIVNAARIAATTEKTVVKKITIHRKWWHEWEE